MIRYILDGETLLDAIIHASMMASVDPDHSYVIICKKCHYPIEDHRKTGDCEEFQALRKKLENA